MKLFIVLDHESNLRCICRKEENAEARVPSVKKSKKQQQADKSWSYGRKDPWSIRHVEVQGQKPNGIKTQFVYADEQNNLHYSSAEGRKEIRILDNDGLWVQEAQ